MCSPISGAIFQWSSRLAGTDVGWFTGWVMVVGQVLTVATAAIAMQTVLPAIWPGFQIVGGPGASADPATATGAQNAVVLGLAVLVLSNFVRDVPNELFESMRLDGTSEWGTAWRLAFPLTRPAVVTVAIYTGLQVWNGFLLPLVLTQSQDLRVLPLALWSFQGQYSVNVPAVLAAVVLSTLPILVFYVVGRRQLVSGLTAGFSK